MEFVMDLGAAAEVAGFGRGLGFGNVRLERLEVGGGAPRAREPRHLGADQDPRFGQVLGADVAQAIQVGKPGDHRVAAAFADEGSARGAFLQFEQARDLQRPQGFAQGIAAHAELVGEIPFRRQAVAGLERLPRELVADLRGDLLERAARGHGPKRGHQCIPSRWREITTRWIWLVPSKIWLILASRM